MLEVKNNQLKEESKKMTTTINSIIKQHTRDLDNLVDKIQSTLKKVEREEIEQYPYQQLELHFALLTTEIYKVNSVLAELGGTSDLARSKREIAFSKAYMQNNGNTIKEKEALATIDIELDLQIEKIYNRILTQLKMKTDNAENIHLALKRMHSARLTELEVFRVEELKRRS